MNTQINALIKMKEMYISGKIDLGTFRTSIMRCKIMVEDNIDNVQEGVITKLEELSALARNL